MNTSRTLLLLAVLFSGAARRAHPGQSAPIGASTAASIEKLQPELDELVPAGAQLERVATGFKWTEGPIWVKAGFLLFAEIPSNSIRKWTPGGWTFIQPSGQTTPASNVTLFMQPSGYQGTEPYSGPEPGSNGMTLDARGRLTVAGHARRSVWRLETMDQQNQLVNSASAVVRRTQVNGITELAETYRGKRLNSPNDLVYKSDGSLYFTDPPYGLRTQGDHDPEKQLQVNGVYRLAGALEHPAAAPPEPDKLELLIADLPRPNGIAFSPDEKYVYVNNSQPQKIWMRYPVKADGTLGAGTVFYDATSDQSPGAPDGMKVDTRGNLYSAGPGGVWIFSPGARHLGTIRVPEKVGNLAFGDADAKTLYITASSSVYRLHVNVAGVRP